MLRASLLTVSLIALLFAGCLGTDDGRVNEGPDPYIEPTYEDLADLPDRITGVELFGASEVPTGAGIWVDGDFAYVGARNDGFYVANISDPSNISIVSRIPGLNDVAKDEGGLYGRDVDLLKYDDGRKVAVVAGQSVGLFFVDVTDPKTPEILSIIENTDLDDHPSHNVDVIPGTTFLFNAPSGGEGRTNHLIDAADPENPQILEGIGAHGCHDITFFIDADANKSRAYCAGRDITEIWDIGDLEDIKILTQLSHPVVDNGGGLHHLAMVNQDATLLIVGDEFNGGGGPGCGAHIDTAAGTRSTPLGALWFFDIAGDNELAPKELSSFSPDMPVEATADYFANEIPNAVMAQRAPGIAASCTSHFGSFIGDTPVLAMGWYLAGVILIDLSDPQNPREISRFAEGTNTWDVKFHRNVLITGDMARGLDVLKLI